MNPRIVALASAFMTISSPHCGVWEQAVTTYAPPSPDSPLAKQADAVFLGKLLRLGPPPVFVAGERPAIQRLIMNVETVWKGALTAGQTLEVDVVIIAGGEFVVPGADGVPQLDPSVFAPDQPFVVYANPRGAAWQVRPEAGAIQPWQR